MKLHFRFSFVVLLFTVFSSASFVFAQPGLQKAMDAQAAHNPNFFANDGVVATGISVDAAGNAIIKVYTKDANVRGIPAFVDGVKVKESVSGIITAGDDPVAQMGPGGGKGNGNGNGNGGNNGGSTDPQARQARPVPIGVSIGTYRPNASNLCFAGTLGCRLQRIDLNNGGATTHFILSNNHVLAEQNAGTPGLDMILQPGTLDNNCVLDLNDVIGTLSDFQPIDFNGSNLVDAAIATTTTADTDFASPADAYGAPTSTTVAATVGMPVQKFGRTTGLRKGEVDSINATVNVQYDSGVATFTNQVIIVSTGRGRKRAFSDSGDSGSLIVTESGNNPTGLLFAGSSSVTIANPINAVLDTFSDPGNGILFIVDDGNQ